MEQKKKKKKNRKTRRKASCQLQNPITEALSNSFSLWAHNVYVVCSLVFPLAPCAIVIEKLREDND